MAKQTHASAAPRVLLLTSTLGSGHLRAAQAVELALRESSGGAAVQTLDFWSLMDAGVAHALRQTYLWLVQERPELYERLYQLDERTWRDLIEHRVPLPATLAEALQRLGNSVADEAAPHGPAHRVDRWLFRLLCALLNRRLRVPGLADKNVGGRLAPILIGWGWMRMARRLHARLRAFDPDVVVATQMHPSALFSFVKTRRRLSIPALGVPTDFGMHDFWWQPGIDRYCVPHASITAAAATGGQTARMLATGIPLLPGFRDPPSQSEARLRLQLEATGPVVLVLGGGLGLGVAAMAARLLDAVPGVHLLVLAGSNAVALASLDRLKTRYPGRLSAHGWTEQTEVFLRAADVVVGKPGGLTVAEALACGRPLLATRSLRGQESFNLRFLEQHGVGRLVPEDGVPAAIEALLVNPGELARMKQRADALGRRDGAAQVAAAALALAQTQRDQPPLPTPGERWRRFAQRCLLGVDHLYQRWRRLQPVGEVLYVGRSRYRGPSLAFADGSRLAPGDLVGTLHFNNARILRIQADSARRAALRFAPLMLESMRLLAQRTRHDPQFADLSGYHAVTWMPAHGQQLGFLSQPLPPGPLRQLLGGYFRLLVWAFAPAAQTRVEARPEPTTYWLSREQLLQHFDAAPEHPKE